jgi:hypothetical protein
MENFHTTYIVSDDPRVIFDLSKERELRTKAFM